jgi:hypothetical protein
VLQPPPATVCLDPAAQGGHEKEADMPRTQLIITTAALVAACAVPAAAAAQGQDLRSPDTRDAATAAQQQSYQDLRSPDARDAAPVETAQYSDLRSPDARDAGRTPDTSVTQDLRSPDARDAGRPPVQVATPVVEIREAPGSGFDWGDAGIGAAGMFALFSIAAGLTILAGGRRRRRVGVPAH